MMEPGYEKSMKGTNAESKEKLADIGCLEWVEPGVQRVSFISESWAINANKVLNYYLKTLGAGQATPELKALTALAEDLG